MSQRITGFLGIALYIAFLIFLLIIFALSINAFFNPDPHFFHLSMNYRLLAFIVLLLFLAGIFIVIRKTKKAEDCLPPPSSPSTSRFSRNKTYIKDMAIIFAIAFGIRTIFILFYGRYVYPTTDFAMVHMAAQASGPELYFWRWYELWSHWAIYSIILRIWYTITMPHHVFTQVLNVAVTSLTSVFIYALARNISGKRSIAIAAALFFALYPPNILYNAVMTNEHIPMLFVCIAFLLLTHRSAAIGSLDFNLRKPMERPWAKYYIFCAVAGVLSAFAESMKGVGPIVIIAVVITSVLTFFLDKGSLPTKIDRESVETLEYGSLKLFSKVLVSMLILFITFSISNFAVMRITERILDIEFMDRRNLMANVIYIGLQPSGEGQVHLGESPRKFLVLLEETGWDVELARTMTYDYLFERIRENPVQFAGLFPQKFRWAWQDDTMPASMVWATTSRTEGSAVMGERIISPGLLYVAEEILPTISQIFYIALIAFSAIGLWGAFRKFRERFNFGFFAITLYCFGYVLLLLLIEAQSRYKVMIIPFLCIFASYGLNMIASFRVKQGGKIDHIVSKLRRNKVENIE